MPGYPCWLEQSRQRQVAQRSGDADSTAAVALVTGGSRGLGLSMARELAGQGFRLAICARDPAELADAESDLVARGADVLAVPCDVADRDRSTSWCGWSSTGSGV